MRVPASTWVTAMGCCLAALVASPASAQNVPFKVFLTELWQLDAGVDPGVGYIGDYYATVTINGVAQSRGGCDDSSSGGILVPIQLFSYFNAVSQCTGTPWTFTREVPANAPVTVRIQLFDSDTAFDDEADAKPGSGNAVDLVIDPVTGRWSGGDADADFNWPNDCSRPGLSIGGNNVNVCWQAGFDADADGLLDVWETSGVDTNNDAVVDLDLAALGASPQRKDVFVELDFLQAADHTHSPLQGAIARVVASFADAPVANPDGTNGVQLHVDVGGLYGAGTVVPISGLGGAVGTYGDLGGGNAIAEAGNQIIEAFNSGEGNGVGVDDLKAVNFNPLRTPVFRYNIWGHQTNARVATNDCTSGVASGERRDFLVTLGGVGGSGNPCWDTVGGISVGSSSEQGGTFMHELGHTLGLRHGGNAEENNKPNYLSVMNYSFQACAVPAVAGLLPGACDYSRLVNGALVPPLDEADLDECAGIGGGLGLGSMDWDASGALAGQTCAAVTTNVTADVNNDGICIRPGTNGTRNTTPAGDDRSKDNGVNDGPNRVCDTTAAGDDQQATAVGGTPAQVQILRSFDDWGGLSGALLGFAASGGAPDDADQEPDPTTVSEALRDLNERTVPRVTVDQTGPATAKPGDVLTYAVSVGNTGRGPALEAALTQATPDGIAHVADLGTVVVGATLTRSTTFTVPANACPGGLTGAGALVSFKSFAGEALSASDATPLQILDVAPPTVRVAVSPAVLWPPNHKFQDIAATVTATDNCDPAPAVKLLTITSNEPATGFLGNGDKGPDIDGAALGTDDRAFALRSERGTGNGSTGRVYTITYRVTDRSGNATDASATVTVPANNGN